MDDGKLITLTNEAYVPNNIKGRYPLSDLPFYFPIPPVGDFTRRITAVHAENAVIRRGVVSQEDLAELATDDLTDIEGMDEERAKALIMAARAPWFA